jgi:ABC-type branched-subunit amino acid transport system substrate-binding protein
MEREDLRDLLAYLKMMDREPVPGIADNEVRVGILLPSRGPLAGAGAEVRALLSGHFTEVNARGGLYNRSLVLVPLPFDPAAKGAAVEEARKAVSGEKVFCFLANVGLSPGDEASRYLERKKVPVLVPLLSTPESGYAAGRYSFHVLASIRDQARVMIDFVASRLASREDRVALLYAGDASGRGGAAGAREQAKKHGLSLRPEVSFSPGSFSASEVVRRLRGEEVGAVLYFGGPREAMAFAEEAERLSWRPLFLALATTAGNALQKAPPGFLPSVFLAFPFQPPDPASPRMAEFFSLGNKYGVGKKHRLFQLLAYSGAILLEEGIKRSGKGVTRERFVDSIGNVWKLETGVTPPLTYTPNQRSGATGAAILTVDKDTRRLVPAAPRREPK